MVRMYSAGVEHSERAMPRVSKRMAACKAAAPAAGRRVLVAVFRASPAEK